MTPSSGRSILLPATAMLLLCGTHAIAQPIPQRIVAHSERMPLVENRGQVVDTRGAPRPDVLFTTAARGARLFLTHRGISYVFAHREHPIAATPHSALPTKTPPAPDSVSLY